MRKRLKVKWIEYHSETLEADPDDSLLMNKVGVDVKSETLQDYELDDIEILGDCEPESDEDR